MDIEKKIRKMFVFYDGVDQDKKEKVLKLLIDGCNEDEYQMKTLKKFVSIGGIHCAVGISDKKSSSTNELKDGVKDFVVSNTYTKRRMYFTYETIPDHPDVDYLMTSWVFENIEQYLGMVEKEIVAEKARRHALRMKRKFATTSTERRRGL